MNRGIHMTTNENAPVVASEHGASEINQVNYRTDYGCCQYPVDPVIPELIKGLKILDRLREFGLIDVHIFHGEFEAHMNDDAFFGLFSFGEYNLESHGPKWEKYSAEVDGVEFFCLVERRER